MTLFSRMSKDNDPYKKFEVELNLPHICWTNKPSCKEDCWMETENYRNVTMLFETGIRYVSSKGYFFFSLSIFGFGFSIVKQNEY